MRRENDVCGNETQTIFCFWPYQYRGGCRNFGMRTHANAVGTEKNEKFLKKMKGAQEMKIRVPIKRFPGI